PLLLLLLPPPPISPLFPYTTLLRSAVGHLVLVRERPLRHHVGILPEFQAAGDERRMRVGRNLLHATVRRVDQQTVTRHIAADIADRKSTRLNSSHLGISYAVFCLKK